jgi:hypothetical protein
MGSQELYGAEVYRTMLQHLVQDDVEMVTLLGEIADALTG